MTRAKRQKADEVGRAALTLASTAAPRVASALLSSERQDWITPDWLVELVREVAPIAFDPATTPANPTGAAAFATQSESTCGLRCDWPATGLTFVNPPYGAHLSGPVEPLYEIRKKSALVGIGRGWAERIAQHRGSLIALVPVRTETVWWKRLHSASTLALLWSSPIHGGRISFINPDTGLPGTQSNLASTVFYFGDNPQQFAAVFGPHGTLISGGKHMAKKQARVVDEARRRSWTLPMTDEAKAVRLAFLGKGTFTDKEIRIVDKYRRELEDGTFTTSAVCSVVADDTHLDIVHVARDGTELYRRKQTALERNYELPFGKVG